MRALFFIMGHPVHIILMICLKYFFLLRDPKRIKVWHSFVSNIQKLMQICKTLKTRTIIQLFLQYMPQLIKQFLNIGMPILEYNLKYQTDDITNILEMMQGKNINIDMESHYVSNNKIHQVF